MKRLMLCLLAVIFLLPHVELKAQDSESDAPYLYYYDETVRAFVVERADGTDRHLLGQELMADLPLPGTPYPNPENYEIYYGGLHVDGPGWSPSGEWFAWTTEPRLYPRTQGKRAPFVVNINGQAPDGVPQRYEIADMIWFPDTDKLFIVAQYNEPIPIPDRVPYLTTHIHYVQFLIFDPVTRDMQYLEHYQFARYGPWYASVEMGWSDDLLIVEIFRRMFYVYDKAGQLLHKYEIESPYSNTLEQYPGLTEHVLYEDEDKLHVVNLLDEEELVFEDIRSPYTIYWHDDYGLLDGRYILSLENKTIKRVSEFWVRLGINGDSLWSPDGRYAIIVDDQQTLYFDTQTQSLEPLSDNKAVFWQWLDSTHLATAEERPDSYNNNVIIYDLENASSQHILEIYYDWFHIEGDRLFYVSHGAVVYNFENDTTTLFRPDPASFQSVYDGEVNVNGEWFIVMENALVAGGGYYRHMGVAKADGTLRRDVGQIVTPTAITINWLPPQVNPENLPPPIPLDPPEARVNIIHGDHWHFNIFWRDDGTITTTGNSPAFSQKQITQWNVENGAIVTRTPVNHGFEHYAYFENEELIIVSTPDDCPRAEDDQFNICTADLGYMLNINYETWEGTALKSEEPVCTLPLIENDFWIASIAASPDGKYLSIVSTYNNAYIWNLETCELALTMPDVATGVAFSPDGKYLALGVSWDIQIWDVEALLGD